MESTRMVCLVSFVVYVVALILFLAGFGGPYWLYVDGVVLATRQGLWEYCLKAAAGGWECSSIELNHAEDWFQATAAFMIMALIAAVAAGATRMFMPISSGLEIITGGLTMIAIIIYAAEVDQAGIAEYLDWSFGLATAAGCLFLINGITLAVLTFRAGCDMTRQLPCESM